MPLTGSENARSQAVMSSAAPFVPLLPVHGLRNDPDRCHRLPFAHMLYVGLPCRLVVRHQDVTDGVGHRDPHQRAEARQQDRPAIRPRAVMAEDVHRQDAHDAPRAARNCHNVPGSVLPPETTTATRSPADGV
ncbi:MAG TPA: hypothetical protein VK891_17780, partial [Euzebyales bacterium]|nr:hypothetical protein [Euzebyales bacterium]